MYDPSCGSAAGGCASGDAVRLKPEKESLDIGRAVRSLDAAASGREFGEGEGEGEVGLLAGFKNEGVLSAYISCSCCAGVLYIRVSGNCEDVLYDWD